MNAPLSFAMRSASSTAPFIPRAASVSTIFAPSIFKILRLSTLMLDGITKMTSYPLTAPTNASPMPVLPDVGSTIVPPGLSAPEASASSMMRSATLSLTL